MNKKNNKNLGFTLIEMLVVIAIVVILGTIFFVKMKSGVDKSDDIKIKAKMNEALIQGKLYYNTNGYYSNNNSFYLIVKRAPVSFNQGYIYGYYSSLGSLMKDIEDLAGDYITLDSPNTSTNYGPNIIYGTGAPYTGSKAGSYTLAVPLKTQNIISANSGTDYYCIDSSLEEGKVIDEIEQMTGDTWINGSGLNELNGVASCGN
ncbi:type II secretion system protein [Candidatus Nomurabacteria bacterium]|nr:type II secretion system protein [Candidatus Nomurabacteria bacterium]